MLTTQTNNTAPEECDLSAISRTRNGSQSAAERIVTCCRRVRFGSLSQLSRAYTSGLLRVVGMERE